MFKEPEQVLHGVIAVNPLSGRRMDASLPGSQLIASGEEDYLYHSWEEIIEDGSEWAEYLQPLEVRVQKEFKKGYISEDEVEEIINKRIDFRKKIKGMLANPGALLYALVPTNVSAIAPISIVSEGNTETVPLGIIVSSLETSKVQTRKIVNLFKINPWFGNGAFQYLSNITGRQINARNFSGFYNEYLPNKK